MSTPALSQDEVDALLSDMLGEVSLPPPDTATSGVSAYNFAKQERIVRGRMPTLEMINERFARNFRIALFNFMRRTAEISVDPVKVMKYSEFVRNLSVPTNLNVIQARPLRGMGLFVLEPSLIFLIVESLFGGTGKQHMRVEGRDFTATEQRIIQNLLKVVILEMKKAWAPVFPVEFEYIRSELNTQFANIANPTEIVVTTSFHIDLGTGGGHIHCCLPYAMLEPIRERLASSTQGDRMGVDERWVGLLKQQIRDARVELVANLGSRTLTLKQAAELQVGDFLPFEIPASVVARVGTVPVLECGYGRSNGHRALKIQRFITRQQPVEKDE